MKEQEQGTTGDLSMDPEGMPFLTAEQILQADDMQVEIVPVPEWNGKVRVKALTGTERDNFETSLVRQQGKGQQKVDTRNIRAKLCALTMIGEDGKPLFTPAQVNVLGQKSAAALDRVYTVASRLSKFTKEDMDELVGNSGEGPGDS